MASNKKTANTDPGKSGDTTEPRSAIEPVAKKSRSATKTTTKKVAGKKAEGAKKVAEKPATAKKVVAAKKKTVATKKTATAKKSTAKKTAVKKSTVKKKIETKPQASIDLTAPIELEPLVVTETEVIDVNAVELSTVGPSMARSLQEGSMTSVSARKKRQPRRRNPDRDVEVDESGSRPSSDDRPTPRAESMATASQRGILPELAPRSPLAAAQPEDLIRAFLPTPADPVLAAIRADLSEPRPTVHPDDSWFAATSIPTPPPAYEPYKADTEGNSSVDVEPALTTVRDRSPASPRVIVVEPLPPSRPTSRRSATAIALALTAAMSLGVGLFLGSRASQPTIYSPSNSAVVPTITAPPVSASAPASSVPPGPTLDATPNNIAQISGADNRQSDLFQLNDGPVRLRYNSTGGDFKVRLLPESGADTGDNFSCSGACDREADLIKDAGRYYLSIESSGGSWNVQVGL